jgi:hypothetical protein
MGDVASCVHYHSSIILPTTINMLPSLTIPIQVLERQSRSALLILETQLTHLLALFTCPSAAKWLFPFLLVILLFLLVVIPYDLYLLILESRTDVVVAKDRCQEHPSSSGKEASPKSTLAKTGPSRPTTQEPKAPVPVSKTPELDNAGRVISYGSVALGQDTTRGEGQSGDLTVLSGPSQASRPVSELGSTLIAQSIPCTKTYTEVRLSSMVINTDADGSRNAP